MSFAVDTVASWQLDGITRGVPYERVLRYRNEKGGEHEQDERTCEYGICCLGHKCLSLLRRRDRVVPKTTTGNAISDRGTATQQPARRHDIGMSTGAAATDGLRKSIGVVVELLVSGGMLSRKRGRPNGRGALNKKIMSLPLGPGRRWSAAWRRTLPQTS